MSEFSSAARRLAARLAVGSVQTERRVQSPNDPKKRILDSAPLDRKRGVKFDVMSDSDLERALAQAEKRLDRTRPSATRDRYELQQSSIKAEIYNRGLKAAEGKLDGPSLEDENAPLPPRGPEKPDLPMQDPPPELPQRVVPTADDDSPVHRPGLPPDAPVPGDTPEADVPLI